MKTVVIIGAGPAGLTAAYDLKKQSGNELRVILLEESGEIGGISPCGKADEQQGTRRQAAFV